MVTGFDNIDVASYLSPSITSVDQQCWEMGEACMDAMRRIWAGETLPHRICIPTELVLRERSVPNTDLILEDDTAVYSLYTDQNYVKDMRPYYYGFVNITWRCYANYGSDKGYMTKADRLLEG